MVIERRSNLDVHHHASRRVLRKSAPLAPSPFLHILQQDRVNIKGNNLFRSNRMDSLALGYSSLSADRVCDSGIYCPQTNPFHEAHVIFRYCIALLTLLCTIWLSMNMQQRIRSELSRAEQESTTN